MSQPFAIDDYVPGAQAGGLKQPLTQAQIDGYVRYVQTLNDNYWTERKYTHSDPPKISATEGQRYIKVVSKNSSQTSVHTFLDKTNGDILKGSWKAPVRNGVRGNINFPGWRDTITQHGAVYLR